jgi:hypothetical protein
MKIGSIEITSSRVIVALAVLVNIQGAIGHGTIPLTHMVPATWIDAITSWHNFLAYVGTAIMGAVAAPEAFAARPLSVTPTIVKALIVTFALSFLVGGGSAQAATKPPKVDIVQTLSDAFAKLAAKGTAGLESADALASAIDPDTNQMVDAVAHACYPALIKFVGALPKPSGSSDTDVFVIYERARIARLTIQKGLPSYLQIGCAPLVQDEANLMTAILAIAGVAVGTGGLSLPALPGLLPAISILK